MAFPQHKRLVNALKRAGATVTHPVGVRKWLATKGKNRVEWYTQEGFPCAEKLVAVCICNPHPDTDAMTDLFMDTFHHTIKSAVESLDE